MRPRYVPRQMMTDRASNLSGLQTATPISDAINQSATTITTNEFLNWHLHLHAPGRGKLGSRVSRPPPRPRPFSCQERKIFEDGSSLKTLCSHPLRPATNATICHRPETPIQAQPSLLPPYHIYLKTPVSNFNVTSIINDTCESYTSVFCRKY